MKWERMEIIGVHVEDVDRAVADFSELFGVDFKVWESPDLDWEELFTPGAGSGNLDPNKRYKVAMDPTGFWELIEDRDVEVGIRNVHFKVDDIEAAKTELVAKGLTLVAGYRIGKLREAIFQGEKLRGVRLALLEYDGDSAVEELHKRPEGDSAG